MAVRLDAVADRLVRTTDLLDYNSVFSMLFWMYLSSDTNNFVYAFTLNDNDSGNFDHDSVRMDADGVTVRAIAGLGGGSTTGNGTVLTVAQWYHMALVRASPTDLQLYIDGVSASTVTTNVGTSRTAPVRQEFGAYNIFNNYRLDGRLAAIRAYSTNLSAADILAERLYGQPTRTANLYGDWRTFPGAVERLADWSGNDRHLTAAGTLTDEDPPPLIYKVPYTVIVPTAAVAAAVQPTSLRATTIPHLRQWHPQRVGR